MTKRRIAPVTIQDARIIFRNFAGRKGPYNEEGERSFTVVLPEEVAMAMMEDGWTTIKQKQKYGSEPEDQEYEYHLPVQVEYNKGRPPRCVLMSATGPVELGAEEVAAIDYAELALVDLTLNPYQWEVNGNSGVKAYLKTIFVTPVIDELDAKYAQVPDAQPALNLDMYDDEENVA